MLNNTIISSKNINNIYEKNFILNNFKNIPNYFIKNGKKTVLNKNLKNILYEISMQNKFDFWNVYNKCILKNTTFINIIEFKTNKKSKKKYKIKPLTKKSQKYLYYSWFKTFLKNKYRKNFKKIFLTEIFKILNVNTDLVTKQNTIHKLALENFKKKRIHRIKKN